MKKLFILLFVFATVFSCKEDDPIDDPIPGGEEPVETISSEIRVRNEWIEGTMAEVYLWEADMPTDLDPQTEPDSKEYFEKLIYTDDKWSWINDDYQATQNLYSGVTTTAGHSFSLSWYNDYQNILAIVEYVMKGSPAEEAGIKRGDIFISIDGVDMTGDNYSDLLAKTSYELGLAEINNNMLTPTNTISITEVENFQENPIHLTKVIEADGKKVGYFMYNSFLLDFQDEFEAAVVDFKSQGVTDLVIDLRYNGGGSVAAEQAIADLLVQPGATGEIFHTEIWNQGYNEYWTAKYGSDYLNYRFQETENNLNLSGKIVALVTSGTASASEGLLNGLSPFCDLTLIGETTHGKFTAMTVIGDTYTDTNGYADSEWAVIPIIYESRNALNESVKGGMIPDYEVVDDLFDGYQLGDPEETMLKAAIDVITTGSPVVASTKSAQYTMLQEKIEGRFRDGKRIVPMPMIDDTNKLQNLFSK